MKEGAFERKSSHLEKREKKKITSLPPSLEQCCFPALLLKKKSTSVTIGVEKECGLAPKSEDSGVRVHVTYYITHNYG